MKRPGSPASLLFRLVVPACAIFILTILAMIASLFGDPKAPVAQWLDRHVGTLLTVEFIATMVLALLAMTVDRIRTIRSESAGTVADLPAPSPLPQDSPQSDDRP